MHRHTDEGRLSEQQHGAARAKPAAARKPRVRAAAAPRQSADQLHVLEGQLTGWQRIDAASYEEEPHRRRVAAALQDRALRRAVNGDVVNGEANEPCGELAVAADEEPADTIDEADRVIGEQASDYLLVGAWGESTSGPSLRALGDVELAAQSSPMCPSEEVAHCASRRGPGQPQLDIGLCAGREHQSVTAQEGEELDRSCDPCSGPAIVGRRAGGGAMTNAAQYVPCRERVDCLPVGGVGDRVDLAGDPRLETGDHLVAGLDQPGHDELGT